MIQLFYFLLLLLFSRPVVSDSLQPHELQHARPHCSSPFPEVCPSSCPLHWWHLPATSFSEALFSFPSIFPSIRDFSSESAVHIRWPKYWSFRFSISPSKEIPGLISFKMDWLDPLARDSQQSSPTPHFKSINSSALSFQSNSHIHTWPLGKP